MCQFRVVIEGAGVVVDKNRLFWGSRRGMLELDLILLPFIEHHYQDLAQADKERYWALLDCEDQDMFAWLLHRQDPEDPDLKRIVSLVRASLEHNRRTGQVEP